MEHSPSLLLALITCGAIACTPRAGPVEDNLATARASLAAFNAHDWDKQAAFFSDSCLYLDPSIGGTPKRMSRKEKADKHRSLQEWSPDVNDSITGIFGSGDKVVVQFISSGSFRKDSTTVRWSLPICSIFTFENGLIVRDDTYYDRGN